MGDPAGVSGGSGPSREAGQARGPRRPASRDPLAAIGRRIPLPLPVPDWSKPVILGLLLVVMALATRSALASRRARRLADAKARLAEHAKAMQAALVPEVPRSLAGVEVTVAYRPAEGPAAGGDFYDAFLLAPGKLGVILGDVAGHGPAMLEHAALTRYTLRAYLQAGLSPREVVGLAGGSLGKAPGELLVTVAVAIHDSAAGTLTYALAGHPAPIVTGVSMPESPPVCCSPPLGAGFATGRRECTLSLPPGAKVCFFTDGLTEARCGDSGGLLGRRRLRELIESLGERAEAESLVAAVRAFAEATPDDMAACVLACDRSPVKHASCVEELELDAHDVAVGHACELLEAFGLPPEEAERIVDVEVRSAVARGRTVMRVEWARGAARVTVAGTQGGGRTSGRAARGRRSNIGPLARQARALAGT